MDTLTLDAVCDAIIEGESIRQIGRHLGVRPMRILRWIDAQPEGRERYMAAKREMAESFASELMELANEPPPMTAFGSIDSAWVQLQRFKGDSVKWIATKLLPKVYGEKLDVTSEGNRLGLTEEQVNARILALLSRNGVGGLAPVGHPPNEDGKSDPPTA